MTFEVDCKLNVFSRTSVLSRGDFIIEKPCVVFIYSLYCYTNPFPAVMASNDVRREVLLM